MPTLLLPLRYTIDVGIVSGIVWAVIESTLLGVLVFMAATLTKY